MLATVADPAAAEALRPVFGGSLLRVPLLTSAEEAADAIRSSPAAIAMLAADAVDAAATAAVAGGPRGVHQLLELVSQACAVADADAQDEGTGAPTTAAQLAAVKELLDV